MSEIDDYLGDLSELQKYIILLLASNNNVPIRGDVWFQKELFLIAKNLKNIDEEASFCSDMYGPYSENADNQLEELELDDVIKKDGSKIAITNYGKEIAKKIESNIAKPILNMISDFKILLNDLDNEEVLAIIYFTFPDYTDESLVIANIKKDRKEIAIRLYKKDKISLQKASEIAGIPLDKFIRSI
ncbi:MAG TPA: UPF0175 family protein [archaeon]|nr:UPF0175 family protein [archaeon]